MSPLAVFAHLMYVIFSLTTFGMFYDRHRLAPFFEFSRCSFLFFYSAGGLPILSNSLSWSGLQDLLGESIDNQIYYGLRVYTFVSAIAWGLLSTYQTIELSLGSAKLKKN